MLWEIVFIYLNEISINYYTSACVAISSAASDITPNDKNENVHSSRAHTAGCKQQIPCHIPILLLHLPIQNTLNWLQTFKPRPLQIVFITETEDRPALLTPTELETWTYGSVYCTNDSIEYVAYKKQHFVHFPQIFTTVGKSPKYHLALPSLYVVKYGYIQVPSSTSKIGFRSIILHALFK